MQVDYVKYRALLLEHRQRIARIDAASTSDRTVELDQSRVGRLSRMDALQGQAMSAEAKQRRQAELREITAALERIDNESFGYCEDCGEQIAAGRLDADPTVLRCVACASRAERV